MRRLNIQPNARSMFSHDTHADSLSRSSLVSAGRDMTTNFPGCQDSKRSFDGDAAPERQEGCSNPSRRISGVG